MTKTLAALAALLLTATACGPSIDEQAWRNERATVGPTITDWPAYRDLILEVCDDNDQAIAHFIGAQLDAGDNDQAFIDGLRIDLGHACPNRVDVIDQTLDTLNR